MNKTPETCPHCEAWLHRLVEHDRYSFTCGTRHLETTTTRSPDCYERELAATGKALAAAKQETIKHCSDYRDLVFKLEKELAAERAHADRLAEALEKIACDVVVARKHDAVVALTAHEVRRKGGTT